MQYEKCTTELGQWLAGSEKGSVYYHPETDVVSLCLHYMTMRFQAPVFRDLLGMMGFAQSEIQRIKRGLEHPCPKGYEGHSDGGLLH